MGAADGIQPGSTMREVLAAYPGAQRALFRRYHLGGCSSCAFRPEETLEALCRRAGDLEVREVLAYLASSHEEDAKILISPKALAEWLAEDKTIHLLDVRSREEYEAVHLEGSELLSQPVMRALLAEGTNARPLVIIDHQGRQGLDAAAYFLGHGLQNVRCLQGGIDAWAREVEPKMPRYRIDNKHVA
jgi:rhodanese-related sulfurtransferase